MSLKSVNEKPIKKKKEAILTNNIRTLLFYIINIKIILFPKKNRNTEQTHSNFGCVSQFEERPGRILLMCSLGLVKNELHFYVFAKLKKYIYNYMDLISA